MTLEGNKEHLESLHDEVGSLLEFLDNSDNELMKDLQKKVKDLANEVEDEVESQVLLIMEKDVHNRTEANERLLIILQQAIDYVKEELSKQRKNNKLQAGNGLVGGTCSPQSDVSTTLWGTTLNKRSCCIKRKSSLLLGWVADSLLHDVIDKSLVVVSKRSLDGKIKTCMIP